MWLMSRICKAGVEQHQPRQRAARREVIQYCPKGTFKQCNWEGYVQAGPKAPVSKPEVGGLALAHLHLHLSPRLKHATVFPLHYEGCRKGCKVCCQNIPVWINDAVSNLKWWTRRGAEPRLVWGNCLLPDKHTTHWAHVLLQRYLRPVVKAIMVHFSCRISQRKYTSAGINASLVCLYRNPTF